MIFLNNNLSKKLDSFQREKLDSTIFRFYLYRFISRFSFYVPILVVYFLMMQMNLYQIAILISLYGLMTTVAGFPFVTNITKQISPKNMLIAGETFKALAVGLIYFSSDLVVTNIGHFYILIFAQIIGGLGYSFSAGSDGSFLYRYCRDNNIEDYKLHEAKSSSMVFLSFLGAGIIGGIVSTFDIRLPFLLTFPAHIICVLLVFSFKNLENEGKNKIEIKNKFEIRKELKNRKLLSDMFFYSVSRAIIMTLSVSIFPFYFFETLHISVAFFGLILGSYTLTGFFVGKSTMKLREKFGEHKFSLILISSVITSLVLLSLVHNRAVVFAPFIMYIMTGAVRPHSMTRINEGIKFENNRTAIISLTEAAFGLVNVLLVLVCFWILNTYDIYTVFKMLLAIAIVLYSSLFVLSKGKI